MIYEYDLVVPAARPANDPVKQAMKLCQGIVHKLEIQFPFGCNNAVSVTITRALHQVWPTNPDGQHKANGYVISFPVWYELSEAPYELEIVAWAPSTTYAHRITVRVGIERADILQPGTESIGIIKRLGQMIFGGG